MSWMWLGVLSVCWGISVVVVLRLNGFFLHRQYTGEGDGTGTQHGMIALPHPAALVPNTLRSNTSAPHATRNPQPAAPNPPAPYCTLPETHPTQVGCSACHRTPRPQHAPLHRSPRAHNPTLLPSIHRHRNLWHRTVTAHTPPQVVCNNSHRYQIGTYSRAFCQRSHDRYTLCGYHGVEAACDKRKDWRQCPQCAHAKPRDEPSNVADVSCCGVAGCSLGRVLGWQRGTG